MNRTLAIAWMMVSIAWGSESLAQPGEGALRPASPVCVAVIEPEVSADVPPARGKALAGLLDTVLTESLAKQKDLVLVDRQMLDKVLEEKARQLGGAAKTAAADVAAPLRPFWTAGVLVCSRLGPANPKEAAAGPVLISLEAVAAQTGQLLAELHFTAKPGSSDEAATRPPDGRLEQFWQAVRQKASRAKGLPLVEVSETQLVNSLPRLQWMADDLTDTLRAVVAASPRASLLTPRHPSSTREERLLRVMGLAAAKPGDPVADLAAASDARVAAEVREEQATGIPFGKTPVAVRLRWQGPAGEPAAQEFKGTVGQYEEAAEAGRGMDRVAAGRGRQGREAAGRRRPTGPRAGQGGTGRRRSDGRDLPGPDESEERRQHLAHDAPGAGAAGGDRPAGVAGRASRSDQRKSGLLRRADGG